MAIKLDASFAVHPGVWLRAEVRFEKAFGVSADTLVRMQAVHDLAQVRAREGAIEVERVVG